MSVKLRRIVAAAAVAATLSSQAVDIAPASAYPTANVELAGHGWGHGRGLSQWGALGYAVDESWSWQQILDRYYGGTSFGAPAPNLSIGVRLLTSEGGPDAIITSTRNFAVGSVNVPGGEAARVRRVGANTFTVDRAPTCAGPWTNNVSTGGGPVASTSQVAPSGIDGLLQVCSTQFTRAYRGTLTITEDSGALRTVNQVDIESYLRGVVPHESPASWGGLGGGKGMNALRAQAVAARSYVLAAPSYSYANTCDTTACQVYYGAYQNGQPMEFAQSDTAIAETVGVVRRFGNGNVARTEFSSSSGGYTAGGTFPAVEDAGDDYSGNTRHNWTASIPVPTVESKYPSIGALYSININGRNGLGDYGGRVTSMTLLGSGGQVTVSGDDFRTKLGLNSNWFQLLAQPSGGVNGYWQLGNDGGIFAFGNAPYYGSMGSKPLNRPVVGLTPTADSGGYWEVASDGGIFSFGNAQFHGSMGGMPLNQPVVAMTATPDGAGYWEVASDGGIFAFGSAQFYGSMGGKPLNKPIVGMASTPSGHGYWLVASDGGIFAYGDATFLGSTGGVALRQPIVGMAPTVSGGGYWMVASDGGIFAFGNAGFHGSLPAISGARLPATGMAATKVGGGYLITSADGTVYSFGDAPQFGGVSTAIPGYKGRITGIATFG